MAADVSSLPKNPEALVRVIRDFFIREELRNGWRWTRWLLAGAYLEGFRVFNAYDPFNVRVGTYHLENDGKFPVQVQELLSHFNRTAGTLAGFDMRPSVVQDDNTLSSIRERAMCQLVLDSAVDKQQLDEATTRFSALFTALGCCGISGNVQDHPSVGLTADLEVVHPREIFFWPTLGWDYTKQTGIGRQRLVSLAYLEQKFGRAFTLDEIKLMDTYRRKIGEVPSEQSSDMPGYNSPRYGATGGSATVLDSKGTREGEYVVVKYRELWEDGPRGTVARYVCTSGLFLFMDKDLSSTISYPGLHAARFYENLSPYGAGLFDLVFSMVREFEKMVKSLIQNTKDLDRYPVTILPHGTVREQQIYKDTGNPLRLVFADLEPRYGGLGDFRPTTIPIHNAGDMPGRTASFLREMVSDMVPIRDITKSKGRLDSASALRFLDEQQNKGTATPVKALTMAWGGMYRSVAADTVRLLVKSPRPIPAGKLTTDLVGAVINWDTGTVNFKRNPLPDISRLTCTIRDVSPRSKAVRKQEALELRQDRELVDTTRLILLNLKEGLDLALYCEGERAAVETFTYNVLRVYNDGISPGKAWINPHTEKAELQLRLLEEFMSSVPMRVASPAVVNEFIKYRKTLLLYLQQMLPQDVPDPYEQGLPLQGGGGMLPQNRSQPQPQLTGAPSE